MAFESQLFLRPNLGASADAPDAVTPLFHTSMCTALFFLVCAYVSFADPDRLFPCHCPAISFQPFCFDIQDLFNSRNAEVFND